MPIINLPLTAILPIKPNNVWRDGAVGTHILLDGRYFNEYYGYEIVAYYCDELGNRVCGEEVWKSNHATYDSMVQKFASFCTLANSINIWGTFPDPECYRGY